MDPKDESEATAVITASGLGVDGEHGPLFSAIDLALPEGFHAIQMPGGPGQTRFAADAGRSLQAVAWHRDGAR